MKRTGTFLAVVMGFLLWFPSPGPTEAPVQLQLSRGLTGGVLGDANANGKLDIGDAMAISQLLGGLRSSLPGADVADINQNGKVDIGDALFISQVLGGLRSGPSQPPGPVLPTPTPTQTPTPTDVSRVQLSISSQTVLLHPGDTHTFTATVTGTENTAVVWTIREGASGGSIDNQGTYTAPDTPGEYHVVATSQADLSLIMSPAGSA